MLSHLGINLFRQTQKERVSKLISSLHPRKTSRELVRFGPKSDGGYLIPNDFHDIKFCFSPGVLDISGFEYDCIKKGINVFMADRSVTKPNIDGSEGDYDFICKYIGVYDNEDFITMDS